MDPEAIAELFAAVGPVRTRRMFGGQGIYAGELMFALEVRGELYLKVDDRTLAAFQAAGSRPFVYERDGRVAEMRYWHLPETALDDPKEAGRWGRLGLEAAQRAAARKAQPARPRRGARRCSPSAPGR